MDLDRRDLGAQILAVAAWVETIEQQPRATEASPFYEGATIHLFVPNVLKSPRQVQCLLGKRSTQATLKLEWIQEPSSSGHSVQRRRERMTSLPCTCKLFAVLSRAPNDFTQSEQPRFL